MASPSPSHPHAPATPSGDLAVWTQTRRDGPGLLSAEMVALCMSGVSVHIGVRGPNGRPVAGQALGARADATGEIRILLPEPANREILAAVAAGSPVAATFSRPRDHRAIQVKAGRGTVGKPGAEDLSAAAVQALAFRDALVEIGYAPSFAAVGAAYLPAELACVCILPERAFVQTPGPGAGIEISR